jgi:UDP-3-O-[3-hydroxymyristoyl] glucosamine N-acyltransferase
MPAERSLGELATLVGGQVRGDPGFRVEGVAPLEEAGPRHLSFFSNRRYKRQLEASQAGAVIVAPDDVSLLGAVRPALLVSNPYVAFARISAAFHPVRKHAPGVDARASVHAEARVDAAATVMALAYVGQGATVGAGTVLYPGVIVMEEARIGRDRVLYPNAVVREQCVLGDRVILQPGAMIGGDGFGFAFDPETLSHLKIPQAGTVKVEDDVEIGACSCVDRATFGETRVGAGTKIDNLVQVAHNVEIGPLSLLCGQAGVSGSAKLGAGVVLGGQVGIAGHVTIGDQAKFAAQSGVHTDVPANVTYGGSPFLRLADLVTEVRHLRQRVAELESGRAGPGGDGKGPSRS